MASGASRHRYEGQATARAVALPTPYLRPAPNASGMLKGGWLLTLTDCILLLLTFFVMLVATSSVKNERWREMSASLTAALRPITAFDPRPFPRPFAQSDATAGKRDVDYMAALLAGTVASDASLAGVVLQRTTEGLTIRLPATAFVDDGMTAAGRIAARALVERLRLVENELVLRVRATPQSPGWSRAMLRGFALVQAMREFGLTREMAILGGLEGQPVFVGQGADIEIVLRPARAGGS